jgi:SAM-dependent methyltransferase
VLYTQPGEKSFSMIQAEPELFTMVRASPRRRRACPGRARAHPPAHTPAHPRPPAQYHDGFRAQVAGWPANPLDIMIAEVAGGKPGAVVADLGCGEGRLGLTLAAHAAGAAGSAKGGWKVHSFDLATPAGNPSVVACDMSRVPLPDACVDTAIFCLSLMGTNYWDFLLEADRILKPGGRLLIAEVRSRFESGAPGGGGGGGPQVGQKRGRQEGGGGGGGGGAPAAQQRSSVSGGVDAFVRAITRLGARGYEVTRRDESNTMFVLLFLRKRGEPAAAPAAPGAQGSAAPASSSSSSSSAGAGAAATGGGDGGGGGERLSKKQRKLARAQAEGGGRANGGGGGGGGAHGAGSGGGGGGRGGSAPPPALKACVYKKR